MSRTAIGGGRSTRGLVRALAAGLFALVLALGTTTPAVAEEHEDAEDGIYSGELDAIDTTDDHFDATVAGTPPGQFRFHYDEDDDFHIGSPEGINSDVDMEAWECVAELTIDDELAHFIAIVYQTEEESEFHLNTNVDDEQLEGCGVEVDDDDNDEAPPDDDDNDENDEAEEVERAERVDTGAGGTAVNGAATSVLLLVFLLGLGLGAGAVTLRRSTAN